MVPNVIITAIALASLATSVRSTPQTLPTVQDYSDLETACFNVQDILRDVVAQIRNHQIPDPVKSQRMTYCLGALFYGKSNQAEMDMDLLYNFFGQGEDRQEFDWQKRRCMEENGALEPGLSKYNMVRRKYRCFAKQYQRFSQKH